LLHLRNIAVTGLQQNTIHKKILDRFEGLFRSAANAPYVLSCHRMLFLVYTSLFFLLCYGILLQLYYTWWKQAPLFVVNTTELQIPDKKITVIVPARNEAANIAACIESLLRQDYPTSLLEIIVVNDQSTDDTAAIVQSFQHPCLQLIHTNGINGNTAPKKRAIELAIKIATGDLIITTDADCTAGPNWIKTIAAFYHQTKKVLIAAPVKMSDTGSLLSRFQCLDFLTMQGITIASMHKRLHTMGNGANLAYEKKAFEAVNGFTGIDTIASGDDMLLVNKITQAYSGGTGFLKSNTAIVSTHPVGSWGAFFQQRIRWASKATHYKEPVIFAVLLLVYITNFLLLCVAVNGLWQPVLLLYFATGCFIKFCLEVRFVQSVARFFNQPALPAYLLLLQPLHILYIVVSGFLAQVKTYEWKGRKLR
jgi:cellulose synthase/poly-beta-1,6-N-acetylglucosamine synthase-like glycosyltransferase